MGKRETVELQPGRHLPSARGQGAEIRGQSPVRLLECIGSEVCALRCRGSNSDALIMYRH
jgi:hypothetical protein